MLKCRIMIGLLGAAIILFNYAPAAAQEEVGKDFTVDGRPYRIEVSDVLETVVFRSGDKLIWSRTYTWPQLTFLKGYVLADFRVYFYECSYGDNANNAGTVLLAFIFKPGGAVATEIDACRTAATSEEDLLWDEIEVKENRELHFLCGQKGHQRSRVGIVAGEIKTESFDPPVERPTFAGGVKAGRYVLDECWLKCNLYDNDCRLEEIQGLGLPVWWGEIKGGKVLSSKTTRGQLLIGPFGSIDEARAALGKIPVYAEGKCANEDFIVQVARVIVTLDSAGKITACENENNDMEMCRGVMKR